MLSLAYRALKRMAKPKAPIGGVRNVITVFCAVWGYDEMSLTTTC